MGRLMKNLKKNGLTVAALLMILAVLLLTSCQDIGLLLSQLDDEVKVANDRYLQVTGTFPEQNDQNLSPKIELLVSLDRDVDPEAIRKYLLIEQRDTDGIVTAFGDCEDITEEMALSYSTADKTLSIIPSPFWAGGDKITVSLLPGATALDGSVLRSLYSWSFYTVKVPLGFIGIVDGPNAQPGYTSDNTPAVNIVYSNAGEYYLDWDKSFIDAAKYIDWGWVNTSVKTGEELPAKDVFPLGDALPVNNTISVLPEGENIIYAVFKDPSTNTISDTVSDTVFVDTSIPVVAGTGTNIGPVNLSFSRTGTASDTGSGLYQTEWKSSPVGITFGSSTALTTSIVGPANTDQPYTISLQAVDMAGNVGSSSFTLDWDSQAPTAPAFTAIPPSVSTTDNTPTWSWEDSVSADALSTFRYHLDSYSWVENSSDITYTPSALSDGLHYFYVGQYDNVGNFGYRSDSCVINIANISPYNSQTRLSTTTTYLNWPSSSKATYAYRLYEEVGKIDPLIASGSTGTVSQSPTFSKLLATGTMYKWYYDVTTIAGTITRGPYYFTTTTSRF